MNIFDYIKAKIIKNLDLDNIVGLGYTNKFFYLKLIFQRIF